MKNTKLQYGLTLIELMVVLGIASILISIAVPGMSDTLRKNEVRSVLTDVNSALAFARNHALTKKESVSICAVDKNLKCSQLTSWDNGWIIFIDKNEDGVLNKDDCQNTEDCLLRVHQAGPRHIQLKGKKSWVSYNIEGARNQNSTNELKICDKSDKPKTLYAISISLAGGKRTSVGGTTAC